MIAFTPTIHLYIFYEIHQRMFQWMELCLKSAISIPSLTKRNRCNQARPATQYFAFLHLRQTQPRGVVKCSKFRRIKIIFYKNLFTENGLDLVSS